MRNGDEGFIREERTQVRYLANAGENSAPTPIFEKQAKDPSKFYIGGFEVTGITGNGAKVGCTQVTRADAEELMQRMNRAHHDFSTQLANLSVDEAKKVRDFLIAFVDDQSIVKKTFPIQTPDAGWGAADAPRSL